MQGISLVVLSNLMKKMQRLNTMLLPVIRSALSPGRSNAANAQSSLLSHSPFLPLVSRFSRVLPFPLNLSDCSRFNLSCAPQERFRLLSFLFPLLHSRHEAPLTISPRSYPRSSGHFRWRPPSSRGCQCSRHR